MTTDERIAFLMQRITILEEELRKVRNELQCHLESDENKQDVYTPYCNDVF
jgi:hypothetical protein